MPRVSGKKCACGCGESVPNHRNFVSGHDSTLLNYLCLEYGGLMGIRDALSELEQLKFEKRTYGQQTISGEQTNARTD